MKKLLFALPVVLLLAAGCNSNQPVVENQPNNTQPTQTQQTPPPNTQTQQVTPTPTPTSTTVGPMPTMTYKVVSSSLDASGYGTTVIDLYADGNKVSTVSAPVYEIGKVSFFAGNSQKVLFSVLITGIGGFTASNPDIYKLDLQNKTVTAITQNNAAQAINWTTDLGQLAYTSTDASGNYTLHVVNTDSLSNQAISLPTRWAGTQEFILGVKFSPDNSKIAIAAGYGSSGPYPEGGAIYIANLSSKAVTTYQQDNSKPLQVNGWKNNTDVDWSYYK